MKFPALTPPRERKPGPRATRRGFLALLGLAAPAAALAPEVRARRSIPYPRLDKGDRLVIDDPRWGEVVTYTAPLEGTVEAGAPLEFDPLDDEIGRFARAAFGRKELYQWPDPDPSWPEEI